MTTLLILGYLSNTGASGYFDIFDWRASTEKLVSGGYLNYLETTIYAEKIWSSPYGIQDFLLGWGSINTVPIRNLEIFATLKGINWLNKGQLEDTAQLKRWFGGMRDFEMGVKYQFLGRRNWGLSGVLSLLLPTGEKQEGEIQVGTTYTTNFKVREGLLGGRLGVSAGYDFISEQWSTRLMANLALGFGYNVDTKQAGFGDNPLFVAFGIFTSYYDLESGFELKYYGPLSFNSDFLFATPMIRYRFFNGGLVLSAGTNVSMNYYVNRYYLSPDNPEKWEWNWELFAGAHVSPARIAERMYGPVGGAGPAVFAGGPAVVQAVEEMGPRTLLVIVVDSLSGEPIPGAKVQIVGKVSTEGATDESGTYRNDSLPASNYLLTISKDEENYHPIDVGVNLETDAVVKVKLYKKLSRKPKLVAVVYFDTDKTIIKPKYQKELNKVGEILMKEPYAKVIIRGHADRRGGAFYNELLSKKRALAVKEYLIRQFDLDESRFEEVANYTIFEPTGKGLSKDRRVEVYVLLPEGSEKNTKQEGEGQQK